MISTDTRNSICSDFFSVCVDLLRIPATLLHTTQKKQTNEQSRNDLPSLKSQILWVCVTTNTESLSISDPSYNEIE